MLRSTASSSSSSSSSIPSFPSSSSCLNLFLLLFLTIAALLFCSTTNALPTPQKTAQSAVVGPQGDFHHFYLENAADFPPIMEKRRSAEFINGLLSLERLNAMGKRAMPPSLLWNMEK